ncbi:hypothetical protein BGZ83_001077, partial [Gryganskiella cystojenkinii]
MGDQHINESQVAAPFTAPQELTVLEGQAAHLNNNNHSSQALRDEGIGFCPMAHWMWELPFDSQLKSICAICLHDCED